MLDINWKQQCRQYYKTSMDNRVFIRTFGIPEVILIMIEEHMLSRVADKHKNKI